MPTPGQPERGSYEKGSYAQFAQAFHQLQVLTLDRQRSSRFWPAMEFFRDKTAVHNKSVDAWILPRISAALDRKRKREGKWSDENEASFVDYLVDFTKDVKLIRDEVCEYSLKTLASRVLKPNYSCSTSCWLLGMMWHPFSRLLFMLSVFIPISLPSYVKR